MIVNLILGLVGADTNPPGFGPSLSDMVFGIAKLYWLPCLLGTTYQLRITYVKEKTITAKSILLLTLTRVFSIAISIQVFLMVAATQIDNPLIFVKDPIVIFTPAFAVELVVSMFFLMIFGYNLVPSMKLDSNTTANKLANKSGDEKP